MEQELAGTARRDLSSCKEEVEKIRGALLTGCFVVAQPRYHPMSSASRRMVVLATAVGSPTVSQNDVTSIN